MVGEIPITLVDRATLENFSLEETNPISQINCSQ